MTVWSTVRRAMRHTRIVQSGSPPLYRINLLVLLISAIVQAALGDAPQSVAENSPWYFDYLFISSQLVATIMIITALYMEDGSSQHAGKLHRSLALEFIGLIFLQTVMLVNVVAVMFMNQGPPAAPSTWLMIGFSAWVLVRMSEVRKALRELVVP